MGTVSNGHSVPHFSSLRNKLSIYNSSRPENIAISDREPLLAHHVKKGTNLSFMDICHHRTPTSSSGQSRMNRSGQERSCVCHSSQWPGHREHRGSQTEPLRDR